MANAKLTFEQWKRRVDQAVERRVGLGIDDLPDLVDARREYEDGTTPYAFALKAIRACEGGAW